MDEFERSIHPTNLPKEEQRALALELPLALSAPLHAGKVLQPGDVITVYINGQRCKAYIPQTEKELLEKCLITNRLEIGHTVTLTLRVDLPLINGQHGVYPVHDVTVVLHQDDLEDHMNVADRQREKITVRIMVGAIIVMIGALLYQSDTPVGKGMRNTVEHVKNLFDSQ